MSKWLIRKKSGRAILGPFSDMDVAEKLKAHEVELDDYICEEGFATWTTLDKRKELTKLLLVDTQAERRKSLAKVDAETASEEIILEGETPEIRPDVDKKSRTWIRWLALGVLSVAALIVIRFQLTTPIDGELSPPPPPKTPEFEQKQDLIRSHRATQPTQNQYDPNAVQGVSRFTTIDPTAPQEQTGGTLLEGEGAEGGTGPRRRAPPGAEPHRDSAPPPPAEEQVESAAPPEPPPPPPPPEEPEVYEPPDDGGPPPEAFDEGPIEE